MAGTFEPEEPARAAVHGVGAIAGLLLAEPGSPLVDHLESRGCAATVLDVGVDGYEAGRYETPFREMPRALDPEVVWISCYGPNDFERAPCRESRSITRSAPCGSARSLRGSTRSTGIPAMRILTSQRGG